MQEMQASAPAAQQAGLLTTRDVQRLIRVDRSTIYRMAEDGRLPAVKVGRQWRFPEDRLREWLGTEQSAPAREPNVGLGSALTPSALQAVSDFLGDALATMVVLTDLDGKPLASASNPCGLFAAAHRHPGVLEQCIDGWQALAAEVDLEPHWRVTPFGFLCARGLVRDGGRLVGMIVAGGVAPAAWPPSPAECARLAQGLGIPPGLFSEHASEVHYLDESEQARVLRLLPRSGALLSRLAAERHHLVGRLEAIAALAADSSQRSEP
jgi:excisionase family DNA binding protein